MAVVLTFISRSISHYLISNPKWTLDRYILEVAAVLRDQYDGDIPDSVEGLCKLKGVGNSVEIQTHCHVGGTEDGPLVHECCLGQAVWHRGGRPRAQVRQRKM